MRADAIESSFIRPGTSTFTNVNAPATTVMFSPDNGLDMDEIAVATTRPTNDEIEEWRSFYELHKRLHQHWHEQAHAVALEVKAVVNLPGATLWRSDDVRAALRRHELPSTTYDRLTAYAALHAPHAVYMGKLGRLVLRQRYGTDGDGTTALTDAEITEALQP